MGAYAPESYVFFHYLAMLGAYAPESLARRLLFPFFALFFLQYVSHLYGICDKMVDYRRIFYHLKLPDFVRKVGGYAPDYPRK